MAMLEHEQEPRAAGRSDTPSGARYGAKTERIRAWSEMARNLGRLGSTLIWGMVVLIGVTSVGRYLQTRTPRTVPHSPASKPTLAPINWQHIDQEIVAALATARTAADVRASQALETWVETLMVRVDAYFLPWYFGYWNQQLFALKGLYYSAWHLVSDAPTAAERITEDVQEQFAQRVLRPEIAQKELENLTREVVNVYVMTLRNDLSALASRYHIPPHDWEAHLASIAALASHTEGNRRVDVTLKALTISTIAGSAVVVKALGPVLQKLGSTPAASVTSKAMAPMAATMGAKVAAKAGGKFLGPIVGIGIIVWDVWDHRATKAANQPLLRSNIADYWQEVKKQLLYDTERGVMSVVHELEKNITSSLPSS